MSVIRVDLNKCIGCENCVNICPLDVFYFDPEAHKSVLAYPENCQSCGQCYVNCPGRSLGISNEAYAYPLTAYRGVTTAAENHVVMTEPGALSEFTGGALPGNGKGGCLFSEMSASAEEKKDTAYKCAHEHAVEGVMYHG